MNSLILGYVVLVRRITLLEEIFIGTNNSCVIHPYEIKVLIVVFVRVYIVDEREISEGNRKNSKR